MLVAAFVLRIKADDTLFETKPDGVTKAWLTANSFAAPANIYTGSNVVYKLHFAESPSNADEIIWSRVLPFYQTNININIGFQALGLAQADDILFFCYMQNGVTTVESIIPAKNSAKTNVVSQLWRNMYSRVVTGADVLTTNSTPLIRLHFNHPGGMAWTNQDQTWLRATQYDVQVPQWLYPLNLEDKGLTGGPFHETFPAEDFTNARWGIPVQGIQVGLVS